MTNFTVGLICDGASYYAFRDCNNTFLRRQDLGITEKNVFIQNNVNDK